MSLVYDGSLESTFRRYVADAVNHSVKFAVSSRELGCCTDFSYRASAVAKELLFQLKAYCYGTHKRTVSVHRQWPRDWWEAVKERWAPKWCLKRWPVQYERIDVEETLYQKVCPHIDNDRRSHLDWLAEDIAQEVKLAEGHCGYCYGGPPSKLNSDDPDSYACDHPVWQKGRG